MLTVTDRALDVIRTVVADEALGLRIMVVTGGCAGLQYRLNLEAERGADDAVLDLGGFQVFIDPPSAFWLTGATMDYVEGDQGAGFVFDNPNAKSTCSCSGSC